MLVAVAGATLQVGLPALAGNREGMAELTGWAGRAVRAHRNMIDNLLLFAALVIVVVLTNNTNSTTLLGAQISFGRAWSTPLSTSPASRGFAPGFGRYPSST